MSLDNLNKIASLVKPGKFSFQYSSMDMALTDDFIRIKISYCGVCGTDRSFYLGHRQEGYPISLGHEHCGRILSIGAGVQGFSVGNAVAIDPNFRCGTCYYCQRREGHLCVRGGDNKYSNRGYASHIDIHHSYVHILPPYKKEYVGALVEPLSVALHALTLSRITALNSQPLILGCGGLGSLLIFAILENTGLDVCIHDSDEEKAENIRSIYPQRVSLLKKQGAKEFECIFEATGASTGFRHACSMLAKLSEVIVLSRYHSDEPAIPERLPWRQPEVKFCHLNGNGESIALAADLLSIKWSSEHDNLLSLHPLGDINNVFRNYESFKSNKKILVSE